ncbi:hypothetical protein [Sphingobacterium sp. MYb388]|uniref:hypothetical protein n=1 Tax=Sphingobacterium sp. MYb388 TaxID=2745437 RepID=UPI00309D70D2
MKKNTIKLGLATTLALALFISSCNKDTNEVINGNSTVSLQIGQTYAKDEPVKAASVGRSYASAIQTAEIPFDNEYTLVATLTPVSSSNAASGLKAANRAAAVNTGNEENELKQGTVYYVAIFDAAGNYKETKNFTQGSNSADFAIAKGNYTFLIYASGTNKALPTITAGATLSTVNFTGLQADQDFMLDQVEFEVKAGQNVLTAKLEHLFTQVALKFDTSELTGATTIAGATITPSNENVNVTLANGALTYSTGSKTVPFNLPVKTGKVILSDNAFITTAATSNGTIALSGVSINGSAPRNISKSDWTLRPGVKYVLEYKLRSPISVNIGGQVWALGNLTYSNGVYGFAKTNDTYGNYWFPGFQKPKVIDGTNYNQGPSTAINGNSSDPCSLVLPLNTWRLPTATEFDKLISNTNPNGIDNHGPNIYQPARWIDSYDGTKATNVGMFFGTQINPVDRHGYLYLPYGGAYHNNADGGGLFGSQGYYLLAGEKFFRMGASGPWDINNAAPASSTTAMQIRCVK